MSTNDRITRQAPWHNDRITRQAPWHNESLQPYPNFLGTRGNRLAPATIGSPNLFFDDVIIQQALTSMNEENTPLPTDPYPVLTTTRRPTIPPYEEVLRNISRETLSSMARANNSDFEGNSIHSISPPLAHVIPRRITESMFPTNIVGNAIGAVSSGRITIAEPNNPLLETQLVEFIKNKLSLKVSLADLGAGLEIKVSLNLSETDEELLSDTDLFRN